MKKRVSLFSKFIIASSFIFPIAGCHSNSGITSIIFDNNYQSVWKVGEIDFSALKFLVTLDDGTIETVPVTIDMIDEADLYKFYEVGEWKIRINYSNKYYTLVNFTIIENQFDQSIKLKDEIVAYDGKSHSLSIEGPLPEGTKVYFPYGNSFTASSVNPYKVSCVISKEGYKTKELTGYLTITKSNYSKEILDKIEFNDAEYIYDGLEKRIEAKNVPADCSVEYFIGKNHGNGAVNAGTYTIVGVLKCSNPNYVQIPNIEATLKINKAKNDLQNVSFDNAVFTYEEGVPREIKLTNSANIPNNVKVRYENNIHVDAGEYTATAYFDVDPNHEEIEPMVATMTILPKELDLSTISVKKMQNVKFDGSPKEFAVEAPSYIRVEKKYFNDRNEEVSEPTDVGTYQVKLSYDVSDNLNINNYTIKNPPCDSGLLIIEKKILDLGKIDFENQSVCYDGDGHNFEFSTTEIVAGEAITYSLPEELDIVTKYFKEGVQLIELPKEVGEYIVQFDVVFKDKLYDKPINPNNYSIINQPSKNGVFKIVKNKIDLSAIRTGDQNRYYNDGDAINYELPDLPDSVIAIVKYYQNGTEISEIKNVGTYDVSITYTLNSALGYSNNYYEIVGAPSNTPSLIVQKKVVNLDSVIPTDIKIPFTGQGIEYSTQYVTNFQNVSKYVQISCEYYDSDSIKLAKDELPKQRGIYNVIVSFALNDNCQTDSYSLVNNKQLMVSMTIE